MFPSLREIPGAEDDNRPEALLAAVCAAPAKVIVSNTVSVVEKKARVKELHTVKSNLSQILQGEKDREKTHEQER